MYKVTHSVCAGSLELTINQLAEPRTLKTLKTWHMISEYVNQDVHLCDWHPFYCVVSVM